MFQVSERKKIVISYWIKKKSNISISIGLNNSVSVGRLRWIIFSLAYVI